MNRMIGKLVSALALAVALSPARTLACAACYGQSDSPLAEGMNWGIFSLLGVVVCVLASIATFFVFLGKRSAAISARSESSKDIPAPGQES
jgi:hypothetical protein